MKAHNVMRESGARAMPVMKADKVAGVITLEDISRVYAMVSHAA
jgi:CBS domain-containing protein